jgi:cobalt-zinc-cadmium efflux system protein
MGTSQIALTAHLVVPDGPGDDAFLESATDQLHERFEIEHVTLQAMRSPFSRPCAPPSTVVPSAALARDQGADLEPRV